MSSIIDVTTLHGTEIKYDVEKKQFFARVGGHDIKKSSQSEVEKLIRKMAPFLDSWINKVYFNPAWRTTAF
jgi:hypothetical protein